jgi:hypothetical protein
MLLNCASEAFKIRNFLDAGEEKLFRQVHPFFSVITAGAARKFLSQVKRGAGPSVTV